MIRYYYDTKRDARLRNIDDTESIVPINTPPADVMQSIKENPDKYQDVKRADVAKAATSGKLVNDITEGEYDVIISTGPTYASQRAEAAENMLKMAAATRVSPLDKYLIYKFSDWPGADEAAEIYKKMIPPNLIPPKPGEPPIQPPPPPPQAQVAMAKVQLELEKTKTEKLKTQLAIVKLQNELSQSKEGVSAEIIAKLGELYSSQHPADGMMQGQEGA